MKTVVRCITPRRVVDGWGFEITFRRPLDIEPGKCYILQNRSILRELKTQEELMADIEKVPSIDCYAWYYE